MQKKQPIHAFVCDKNDIIDFNPRGNFKLNEIKKFTENTQTVVFIRNYGIMEIGKFTSLEKLS